MAFFKRDKKDFGDAYDGFLYEPVSNALDEYFEKRAEKDSSKRLERMTIEVAIKNEIHKYLDGLDYNPLKEDLAARDVEYVLSLMVRRHLIEYIIDMKDREQYLERELKAWEEDE